jgi:glycosyltransferase involved in cell wall biosynthesis
MTAEAGLSDHVKLTGWLPLRSPGLFAAYDQADIFCLPSFSEGLPLVLIEAMARGVAVIATNVGGTSELVTHDQTGLLIPRDDVTALATAIQRFLEEPDLWRRCTQSGYGVARKNTFEVQRGCLAAAITLLQP